ncbi:phage tail spike protein [Bacillus mycoides]|uniref:Peptidase S74 domain-containing protein n=1 Tax=Bacillus mycoides (strain KBAB4) TaxID=315730 RepID=A9VVT7_BACMK|nr:phage tail spike protein [Bacillus mycoides]ABY46902.1 hypothetical protein BcerKBAB4_5851 [Bacillus mycoides KBAB4]
MRTPSGDLHVVDFKTSQIVSAIQPKDYWNDKRHWEIKNNIDTLEFKVFENTDHAAMLVQQNLVLKEVSGGRIVPYVITEVEKNSDDRSLTVYASGEWIQLAKAGIIEPQKIESKTLKQCMEIALKGTKCEIGKIEHDGAHSMVIEEFTDPLDLSKKIAASFEVEIQYRAEVVGSQIVVRYVDMVKRRGRDTRKEITVGKDLLGIKRIENSQNICTALLGYVQKENGEFITISEINNGVPYLVDDAAFQRWNEKGKHKFAFYTPQTEDQDMSPQRLMTLMKTEMNKLVNTSVSYEVQAQSIGQVFGLAHELINEGDTIRIIDTGFTPKLYLEARAIAGDESFKDPTQDKYVFGDYREIVDQNDELRRLYQKILSSLQDKVPKELFDELTNRVGNTELTSEEAKKKADQAEKEAKASKDIADQVMEDLRNYQTTIIEQPTAPTEPPHKLEVNKTLWLDSSDPANKILKIYRGNGNWERIVPDTSAQDLELQELINKVNDLQREVTETQQEVSDQAIEINKKVDQTWLDGELSKKANTDNVYTKDYIDENLVGKQIYETDKQANIEAFTDMNTKYEQTAEALTLTATKDELKKVSDDVTTVTSTVNEVKQTSEENSQKITKVEGNFKNMKIGRTNLIENSGAFKDGNLWIPNNPNAEIEAVTLDGEQVLRIKGTVRHSKSYQLEPNTEYIYSAMIKLPVDHWAGFNDPLHSWTAQGTNLHTAKEKTIVTPIGEIKANEWTYVAVRILTADGEPTHFTPFLFSELLVSTNENSYVKFFQITKGNQPITDWIPPVSEVVSTGDFEKKTNEIIQNVDENKATITSLKKSVSNENFLYESSANLEYPKFIFGNDGLPYHFNNAPYKFEGDYLTMTCENWNDAFYQIGDYIAGTNRGLNIAEPITFSYDISSECPYVEILIFQNIGGGWSVAKSEFVPTTTDWKRGSTTFKLDPSTSGWMARIRFDARAESQNKKIWFRRLKMEQGDFATTWSPIQVSQQEVVKKTNEVKQTVDENSQKITSIETTVKGINSDVNNLMKDAGTFEGALTKPSIDNRWWLKDANVVRIAEDTFMGNAVAETQSAWQGLAYNFGDLVRRKAVKEGDVINYSIYTRIKNLPPGEKRHSFYFTGEKTGTEMIPVTSEWGRSNVSFTVSAQMMNVEGWNTEDWLRVEIWEGLSGDQWYQQSSPQMTLGDKVYSWRPAHEDLSTVIDKSNEIKQTVDNNTAKITATEGAIGDLTETFNTKNSEIEQSVDSIRTNVSTMAQTQGEHGELIQDNKSSITQLNNQINLKVSEKQMQDYVGTLGEPNLILNAPFRWKEINQYGDPIQDLPAIDKWGTYTVDTSKGKFEPVVQPKYGGENSINIYCAGFQEDKSWTGINQVIGDVDINSDYTYRAMVYTTNKNSIDDGLYAEIKAWNGPNLVGAVGSNINEVIENGVWKEFVVTLPAMKIAVTHLQITCGVRRNGSIYMSNPMFQKGTTKSVFIPNTKDMGDYNAMVREIGKKVATSEYNQKVTTMETQLNQNTSEISLRAKTEEVYTRTEADETFGDKAMVVRHEAEIKTQADEINLRVKSGDIASSINQTAQSVQIMASKINLKGAVTADSIQSGRLDGVIITTKNTAVNPYWVHMEGQNITLKETKLINNVPTDRSRGYFGFMPNLGQSGQVVRTAIMLGNNYDNANNVAVEGSLILEHKTPDWNNFQTASARIGIAKSRNGDTSINTKSEINFLSTGSMEIMAREGAMTLFGKSSMDLSSGGEVQLTSGTGVWDFWNGRSEFPYGSRSMFLEDKRVTAGDIGDVDLHIGPNLLLRVPNHPNYTKYGVEFKNANGVDLQNIHCDKAYINNIDWTSERAKKTGIKDIEVDALSVMMELQPKQYYFKTEIEKLYNMREEAQKSGVKTPITTKDIQLEYGFIADDMPDCLASPDRKTVSAYRLSTIGIAGTQKVYKKHLVLEETVKTQAEKLEVQAVSIQAQEDRIARLEELLLQQLINKKPEQP